MKVNIWPCNRTVMKLCNVHDPVILVDSGHPDVSAINGDILWCA